MSLVLVIIVAAVVVGWLRGGRLGRLADLGIARAWMLAVAVAAQLGLAVISGAGGPVDLVGLPLLVVSQVAVLGFVWANRLLPGMTLVFLGFALNAAVIIPNGGMPVSADALTALSGDAEIVPGKHRLLTEGDWFPWLADILPIPVVRMIVSVGDVFLAAGVGILVVRSMLTSSRSARRTSARAASQDEAA